jgi:hypothetical protein
MSRSKRKRDYRAEYQRRIERGQSRGLSRSQSRGHPKADEKPIRAPRPIPDKQFQISLKALRSGSTLREVAKQIRVSPERFRNQATALGAIRKQGGRWVVKKSLPRQMLVYTDGQSLRITISQFREASKLGQYMAAVGRFLRTNDAAHLEPFIGKSVRDSKGNRYPLETNPNPLYRIAATGSETFEQIYRIVV